jgi:16S rRNA (guanine966-N2)-methyltransferase
MRIIAGQWRGRPLLTPQGRRIRPTSDRVRENLFNLLGNHVVWPGLIVADLCAGTGALGLEALSRGAAHCVFAEKDRDALALITGNIRHLGAQTQARVIAADVHHLPPAAQACDLILCDPPYADDVANVLAGLTRQGWSRPGTLLALEQAAGRNISADGWTLLDTRHYGKTQVMIFEGKLIA